MSKHKKMMILCVFMIIGSLGLIGYDIVHKSEFIIGNILSHGSLFLVGVFLLYLNLKNERKMKDGDRKS